MTDERPTEPEKDLTKPEKPVTEVSETIPDQEELPPLDGIDDLEMEELFGDIMHETPEDIKAERDKLRKQSIENAREIRELGEEHKKLLDQMDGQKRDSNAALQRVERQANEQKEFALEKFVKEVLPVLDNLERALDAAKRSSADPKTDKIVQGVEKTLGQLTAVFNKFGIKVINPVGQPCDPLKHEVISVDDTSTAESETVVKVAEKGYELNGRVIRTAKVITSP